MLDVLSELKKQMINKVCDDEDCLSARCLNIAEFKRQKEEEEKRNIWIYKEKIKIIQEKEMAMQIILMVKEMSIQVIG